MIDPAIVRPAHATAEGATGEAWRSVLVSVLPRTACVAAPAALAETDDVAFEGAARAAQLARRRHLGLVLEHLRLVPPFPLERRGPHLFVNATPPRWVSVSGSGAVTAVAVAERPVGVDIEVVRILPEVDDMAALFLSVSEQQSIAGAHPGWDRSKEFLAHWTLKEAVAKATGLGIVGLDPPSCTVQPWTEDAAIDDGAGTWSLRTVSRRVSAAGVDSILAVAVAATSSQTPTLDPDAAS